MAGNYWAFEEFVTSAKMNALSDGNGSGIAQNAYQTLQANDVFENKDFLAADEFIDATGTNNTVNVDNFNNDLDTTHDPDSVTSPANFFDNNSSTFAEKTGINGGANDIELGKTFASAKYIALVQIKARVATSDSNGNQSYIKLQSYNGTIWSDEATLASMTPGGAGAIIYDDTYTLNKSVQGLRIQCRAWDASSSWETQFYLLEYGPAFTTASFSTDKYVIPLPLTSSTVLTQTLTLDGTEKAVCVYTHATNTVNTGMSVKAGDGTTQTGSQTITNNSSGVFDITTLSSGTLELEFTLTGDGTDTPEFRGYGVYLIRDLS